MTGTLKAICNLTALGRVLSFGIETVTLSRVKTKTILCAISLGYLFLPAISEAQIAQSTFDSDSEGWTIKDWNTPNPTTILGSFTPAWHSSGGNPGGYISETDPSGNWFWFAAPAKFLGNKSAAYGNVLTFDAFVSVPDLPAAAVMLTGAGQILFFSTPSPTSNFTSFSVPLLPSGWKQNDSQSGTPPSELTMQSVLASLDGLYISGDWHNGIEVAGIDNIALVPEATTTAQLIVGLTSIYAFICLRRRGKVYNLFSEKPSSATVPNGA